MTDFYTTWLPVIILGVVVLTITFFVTYRRFSAGEKSAHRRVSSALRRFASIRGYRVLDDVTIKADGRTLHVDHILVGYFGMLLVADLCQADDYYGHIDDRNWSCNTRGAEDTPSMRKGSIPNPLPNNTKCIELIRGIFSKNGVYNISIDSVAVAAHPRSTLYISGRKESVLTLAELRSLLGKSKYSQDNGVDVEKLCSLLQG